MPKSSTSSQAWYQFVGELDWLLNNIEYAWAVIPLTAIRDTVLATRRVSDGQRAQLDAIRERRA